MTVNMNSIVRNCKKNDTIRLAISIIMTVSSALLQVYVIQVFMTPCNLLAGGFTGLAILLNKVAGLFHFHFSTSIGMLVLNIPAAFLCYKSISKRFTFLSCLQFGLAAIFLQFAHFTPFFHDRMLNVLFGGFLYGTALSLALRADGSTGGTDFIALYVSNKIHRSIWDYVFIFNTIMIIIFGALFGWVAAGYTIIFQFISTQTVSRFYHRYAQVTIEITTKEPEKITEAFIHQFHHGMSVFEAYGAYSKEKYYICKTVVSSYEEADVIECVMKSDSHVIINSYKTNHFYGNFYYKPY